LTNVGPFTPDLPGGREYVEAARRDSSGNGWPGSDLGSRISELVGMGVRWVKTGTLIGRMTGVHRLPSDAAQQTSQSIHLSTDQPSIHPSIHQSINPSIDQSTDTLID